MRFDGSEKDRERFYKKAEKLLLEAGVTYTSVDRTIYGVKGWDLGETHAKEVQVFLTDIKQSSLTSKRKAQLERIPGLEIYGAPVFHEWVGGGEDQEYKREKKLVKLKIVFRG